MPPAALILRPGPAMVVGVLVFLGGVAAVGWKARAATEQEDLRNDIAEMKADIKAIKCKLNIENICPPSR